MNKLLLKLAITAAAGSLLSSNPMVAQLSPTTPKAARVRITQGPELELAKEYLTIIRDHQQPWGFARTLWGCALWYGSQEPEPNCEISDRTKSEPFLYNFPRAPPSA